jgi:glycosyltransferase involved in cell wall biosynthesis
VHDDWLVYGRQHDQWLRLWRGGRRALSPLAERLLGLPTDVQLGSAGPFIFNSRYTRERAREAGITPREATVVHPGIDPRFLNDRPPRRWSFRLLYVGRIDRQKGIDTAVRALAHLPDAATLTVWGTGDQRYIAEMRELAIELGVAARVRFAGWAGLEAVMAAYEEADAVVFPVRWEEPFGLVPLEAMGLARPLVSTARGGTAEFVRDGENALVFEADDAQGLARCVLRLAGDDELRERLRAGGRETAAQYTSPRFAEQTLRELVRAYERASVTP